MRFKSCSIFCSAAANRWSKSAEDGGAESRIKQFDLTLQLCEATLSVDIRLRETTRQSTDMNVSNFTAVPFQIINHSKVQSRISPISAGVNRHVLVRISPLGQWFTSKLKLHKHV